MNLNDEKKTLARRDAKARDFIFPAKDYFLACYATVNGDEMYFKTVTTIRTKKKPYIELRYRKIYASSEGSISEVEFENKNEVPRNVLLQLNCEAEYIRNDCLESNPHENIGLFNEFDRIEKYKSYLKICQYRGKTAWYRKSKRDWPETFLCDAMRDFVDQDAVIWSWPDIRYLKTRYLQRMIYFSEKLIMCDSGTLFPDYLYVVPRNTNRLLTQLMPDNFSLIKKALGLIKEEPMLYRMAEFQDLSDKTLYFIGTFEPEIAPNSSFTTIISYNFHQDRLAIENKFGNQGKILGFRVHIDSPPIVDQISKCAVVLSVSDPEILVICLETFSHLRIDLQNWATDSFLRRWEHDKRRICMTFLSSYTKLVLFPRYPQNYYKKVSSDFAPQSIVLDWTRMKDKVIAPFLEEERQP